MKNFSKVLNQTFLSEKVHKMLNHLETFNFVHGSDIGLHGERLKQNIQYEWLMSNSICCDEPSFENLSAKSEMDIIHSFNTAKHMTKALPFNIVTMGSTERPYEVLSNKKNKSDLLNNISQYFQNNCGTILKRYLFCTPESSRDFFYKLQRERKVWWKKFAASPDRYNLSEVHKKENTEFIEIQSDFPWGNTTVEKVTCAMSESDFEVLEDEHEGTIRPGVIKSEAVLEMIVLSILFDAYDDLNDESDSRMLRLHRKLAPYKVSFAGVALNSDVARNLQELALLLSKKIRKSAISVLLMPDMCSAPIADQLTRNDGLGVPYTVIMDAKTLNDGMLYIRSRDTTLKEQSHVSLLVEYVEKLMKTY